MTFRLMIDPTRDRRTFAPADVPTPPAGDTPPPPGGDTSPPPPPAGKWWEAKDYTEDERQWLTARGMAEDDPQAALMKAVKGHRAAEQRIGKGLDSILDKPAKDQPYTDWVAKNREALGLPADEKGYEVKRPETWPKDAPWDEASETAAKAIAVKYGLPKEALQDLVNLQAQNAMQTYQDAAAMGDAAKQKLMADLEKDYGDQIKAVIHKARLGAQAVGEKAGLQADAIANLADVLTEKVGDANAIRFMAAIGDMLGDDTALGLGKGGGLTTTPAEARADLARMQSPEGEWYKATAANNRAEIERLKPAIDRLNRIAAGGR